MFRSVLLLAFLIAAWSVRALPASAAPSPGPVPVVDAHEQADDPSKDDDGCKSTAIICAGKDVLGGSPVGIGLDVAGGLVGGGAQAVTGGVMNGAVDWVAKGAGWLVEQIAEQVDRSTKPALGSDWFQSGYGAMVRLSILLSPLFLLFAAGQTIVYQEFGVLLRALRALPIAFILTFAAVTIVQLGLGVTDWLTASVLASAGEAPTDAFRSLGKAFVTPDAAVASFVVFLTAVLMAVLALVVWIELALREAATYVAVAFVPLTLVAAVWRPTTAWCRRLTEGLVAIILSKFVLGVAFMLAAGALGEAGKSGGGGLSAIVAGGAVLIIAAASPFVLLRMIPITQAASEQGVSRQHVGGAMRSAPGVTMASGATRMLMYGKFTGGAAPLPSGPAPDNTSVPAAARRGGTAADKPVAVIPDPMKQPTGGRDGSRG